MCVYEREIRKESGDRERVRERKREKRKVRKESGDRERERE